MVTATNKSTGEVIELPAGTAEELVAAWTAAQEYSRVADELKDQLKRLVPVFIGDNGTSEDIGNYIFRRSIVQRMTYDKAVLRRVLDEDTYDLFMKPSKTEVDKFIKDNLDDLGDSAREMRAGMVADGKPYEVIKLEKIK